MSRSWVLFVLLLASVALLLVSLRGIVDRDRRIGQLEQAQPGAKAEVRIEDQAPVSSVSEPRPANGPSPIPMPESEWRRLRERSGTARRMSDELAHLEIRNKIRKERVELDFKNGSLYDMVDFIQEFGKLNIVISAEIRRSGIPDRKIDFKTDWVTISEVLDDLLARYELAYVFENRVLLITSREYAAAAPLEPQRLGERLPQGIDLAAPGLDDVSLSEDEIRELVQTGCWYFDQRRYLPAEEVFELVLWHDPRNTTARALKDSCARALASRTYAQYLEESGRDWKHVLESVDSLIPAPATK